MLTRRGIRCIEQPNRRFLRQDELSANQQLLYDQDSGRHGDQIAALSRLSFPTKLERTPSPSAGSYPPAPTPN